MSVAASFNKHQIYGILRDYAWMLREIQRIDRELQKINFTGTAQYGIEATLPHAQGIVGKALENEVIRRNKKSERLYGYIEKVNYINQRLERVTEEKDKVVLDCLLDGMNIAAIGAHLGVSRKHIHIIRDDIVKLLAE